MDTLLEELKRRGFVVITDALSSAEVAAFNAAADRYIARHPFESDAWVKQGTTSCQALDVLPDTDEFDPAIEHPAILGFARRYFGEEVTFRSEERRVGKEC